MFRNKLHITLVIFAFIFFGLNYAYGQKNQEEKTEFSIKQKKQKIKPAKDSFGSKASKKNKSPKPDNFSKKQEKNKQKQQDSVIFGFLAWADRDIVVQAEIANGSKWCMD